MFTNNCTMCVVVLLNPNSKSSYSKKILDRFNIFVNW